MDAFDQLAAYNKLLAGMSVDFSLSTTNRRIHALMVFKRRYGHLLTDLFAEIHRLWPHWKIMASNSEDGYYDALCIFFWRLECNCRPELLDAWKPFVTRSRNIVADGDKTIRRFLSNDSPAKPKTTRIRYTNKECRVHAEKKAVSLGVCAGCSQRIYKFQDAGIIDDDTPGELLDKLLKMDACRGRRSTMIADAQEMVRNYKNGGVKCSE